jgi:type IV secretion system protein VirB10
MRLMPKAEEPPASAARPPEAISLTPGTATARSDRSNPSEAFLGSRPGGSGAQGPLKMSPALPGGSPFRLLEGSLIPATLETTIHSDLPGLATALVRRDTYDSVTGRYLLIPRGARLVGQYSSETQHGGSRLLLAWTRLLLPDGSSYDLARMPAADLAGASGLPARVNNHWGRLFGSALLLSVVSAGVQLSQAPNDSDLRRSSPTASEVASGALGQELGQVSTGLLRRELDLRPSLSLAAGTPFNVQVATDLEFPAPYARVRP